MHSAEETQHLNHWTTKEVPKLHLSQLPSICVVPVCVLFVKVNMGVLI